MKGKNMNHYIVVQKKDTGSVTGYSDFLINTRKIISYKDDNILVYGDPSINISTSHTIDDFANALDFGSGFTLVGQTYPLIDTELVMNGSLLYPTKRIVINPEYIVTADMATMVDEESEQQVEVLYLTCAIPQLWKCCIKMSWTELIAILNPRIM